MGWSLHVSWCHVYTDWRCIILMQTPSDHLPINALSRPSDGVQYVLAEEDICTAPKCKCHAVAFSLGSKLPPRQLLYTAAWHAQTSKVASSFTNQCWHMACWLQEQYAVVNMVCIASAQPTATFCASVMQEALHALHDVHVDSNSKHKCLVGTRQTAQCSRA